MDAILLRELPGDDIPPPGVYVARTSDQASGVLTAMVAAGDAALLGERYDTDGEKLIAVVVGQARPPRPGAYVDVDVEELIANARSVTVGMGAEYFALALKDYQDWREAWWREVIQNGVDAGATRIVCSVTTAPDGNIVVSAEDNGGGMDEEVLINKFMQLGGTTKTTAGGTTGGFGKAKEVIILPWISYEVHTRDNVLVGSGNAGELDRGAYLDGTRVTVIMPPDNCTTAAAAMAFIGKCDLPNVSFTVHSDGETKRPRANLRVGDFVRNIEGAADIYYDKKPAAFPQALIVRVKGLAMFAMYAPSEVKGQIVCELTRPSTDILTSNRDGFRDWRLRASIDQLGSELSADVKSALRNKAGMIRKKFEGSGKFQARASTEEKLRAAMYESLGQLDPAGPAHKHEAALSNAQLAGLLSVLDGMAGSITSTGLGEVRMAVGAEGEGSGGAPGAALNFRAAAESAAAMLDKLDLRGPTQVEAIVKLLAWEPDFFIVNETEGYHVPKKFFPETMTVAVRKLLRFWAELCRFVLIQLGSTQTYGVGFVFDREVGGEFVHEDGENWILCNPHKGGVPETGAKLLSLADKDDLAWLYAVAVHECTHMADGIHYHNESFASALTRNFALCANKEKQIRALKRYADSVEKEASARLKRARRPAAVAAAPHWEATPQPDPEPAGGWEAGEGVRARTRDAAILYSPDGDFVEVQSRAYGGVQWLRMPLRTARRIVEQWAPDAPSGLGWAQWLSLFVEVINDISPEALASIREEEPSVESFFVPTERAAETAQRRWAA